MCGSVSVEEGGGLNFSDTSVTVCVCVWGDPHGVHVDAVGVGPGVLEVLLQPLPQGVGDLVEADELAHAQHLGVVACCARVQPLYDGRHVAEDAGVHQSWEEERRGEVEERRGDCITRLHRLDKHTADTEHYKTDT